MDIVFTKVGLLVQLEFWSIPNPASPSQLLRTELLSVEQAKRTIESQRPDIYNDFLAWINNNFSSLD